MVTTKGFIGLLDAQNL